MCCALSASVFTVTTPDGRFILVGGMNDLTSKQSATFTAEYLAGETMGRHCSVSV